MDAIGPGLGALCALGSGLTWAVINVIVRRLAPPFNSVSVNALRTSVAGALLVGWVLASDGVAALLRPSATDLVLLATSIVIASSLGDTVFFEGTRRVGVAPALTISMSYPLLAGLAAAWWLAEPLTARRLVGAVATLGGLAMIVASRPERGGTRDQWWLGFGCAVAASLAWAVSAILLKAPLGGIDALTAQAIRMPISGALLFATPWARGAFASLARCTPGMLALVAALCVLTAASGTLFTAGLKYAGVTVGTVLSSTAPMWAVPLGYVGLGDRLPPLALVGVVTTVAGIIVLQL